MSFVCCESEFNHTLPSFTKVRRLERKTQLLFAWDVDIQVRYFRIFQRDVDLTPPVGVADQPRLCDRKATRKSFGAVTISLSRSINVLRYEPSSNTFVEHNHPLALKHWEQFFRNRANSKKSI